MVIENDFMPVAVFVAIAEAQQDAYRAHRARHTKQWFIDNPQWTKEGMRQ